jgi:hypothetical protein
MFSLFCSLLENYSILSELGVENLPSSSPSIDNVGNSTKYDNSNYQEHATYKGSSIKCTLLWWFDRSRLAAMDPYGAASFLIYIHATPALFISRRVFAPSTAFQVVAGGTRCATSFAAEWARVGNETALGAAS